MNKDALMSYIKKEFPDWNWDLLNNIIDYAMNYYDGEELIKFLVNIIPEITYQECMYFMNV